MASNFKQIITHLLDYLLQINTMYFLDVAVFSPCEHMDCILVAPKLKQRDTRVKF